MGGHMKGNPKKDDCEKNCFVCQTYIDKANEEGANNATCGLCMTKYVLTDNNCSVVKKGRSVLPPDEEDMPIIPSPS